MRKAIFLVALVLVTLALISSATKNPAPRVGVSVVFLGFTNSYDAKLSDRSVFFGITNASSCSMGFAIESIEWEAGQGWKVVQLSSLGWNFGGGHWSPGYGCAFPLLIPREVPDSTAWRVRVRCWEEASGFKGGINRYYHHWFSKDAALLRGRLSSIVITNLPALVPPGKPGM